MEKIKLLEVDIDFEKLIKSSSDGKKNIELLKEETKFYQTAIKETKKAIDSESDALLNLSKQGKLNTKEYADRKQRLDNLTKANDTNRQKLEQNNSALRLANAEYRTSKKAIDTYNQGLDKGIKINTTVSGSIKEVSLALSQNKKQYSELTKAQREDTEVGGELLATISKQDKEYKTLQKSIGNTQADVGNYKGQMQELLNSNDLVNKTFSTQIKRIPIIGGFLAKAATNAVKFARGQKASITATTGLSKALKIMRFALISTGIGAIVVLIGTLAAAFLSTQRGIDAFNRAIAPIKGIFNGIVGVIQKLAVNVFGQLKDRFTIVKNFILSGVDLIRLGWAKLFGTAKEVAQVESEIAERTKETAEAQDRLNKKKDEFAKIAKQSAADIKAAKEAQEKIAALQIQIEKSENRLIVTRAELNKQIKEQNKIAEDVTKTEKEREEAAIKSVEASKQLVKAEQDILDLKIKSKELENSQDDTSTEDEKELNELIAQRIEKESQGIELQTTQQNKLNSIRNSGQSKRVAAAKKRVENEIKQSQTLLQIYINENNSISNTLEQRINIFQTASDKQIEILDKELKAKKITQEEYQLSLLELQAETQQSIAEASVQNLNKELELFILNNENKIENEASYLQALKEKRLEIIDRQHSDELISEADFQIAKLEIQSEFLAKENEIKAEKIQRELAEKQAKIELDEINFQNELEVKRLQGEGEFQLQLTQLDRQKQAEIENAEKIGSDLNLIEKKYAEQRIAIKNAETQSKLESASQVVGSLAGFFDEETALAKAAAFAQASINIAQGITKALASKGILGALEGVAISAAGAVQVGKILKFDDGGIVEGKSHEQGGVPFTVQGQGGYEMEGGEFIINKRATSIFRPILERLNSYKNTGATNPYIFRNGGQVSNNNLNINYDLLASKIGDRVGENVGNKVIESVENVGNKVIEAVSNLPHPVTIITDVKTGLDNYNEIVDSANV